LLLLDINESLIFTTDFSQNTQISNFIKICPAGSKVVPCERTDRRTWRTQWPLFAVYRRPQTLSEMCGNVTAFKYGYFV